MRIEKFEDIIAWQKAKNIAILIYKNFASSRDYSFRDQLQRAAMGISNNIAEGFERSTNKELKYFLYIAKGSCGEVRSMLDIAFELGYIKKNIFDEIYNLSLEVSRLLSGFIKKI